MEITTPDFLVTDAAPIAISILALLVSVSSLVFRKRAFDENTREVSASNLLKVHAEYVQRGGVFDTSNEFKFLEFLKFIELSLQVYGDRQDGTDVMVKNMAEGSLRALSKARPSGDGDTFSQFLCGIGLELSATLASERNI